jgi:hypothetical protein
VLTSAIVHPSLPASRPSRPYRAAFPPSPRSLLTIDRGRASHFRAARPPFRHALELFIQSTFFIETSAYLSHLSWQERSHRQPTGAGGTLESSQPRNAASTPTEGNRQRDRNIILIEMHLKGRPANASLPKPRIHLATHIHKRLCAAQPPRRTGLSGPHHRRHARTSRYSLVVLVVFQANERRRATAPSQA